MIDLTEIISLLGQLQVHTWAMGWKLGREEPELRKPDNAKLTTRGDTCLFEQVFISGNRSLETRAARITGVGLAQGSPNEIEGGQQRQQFPTRVARPDCCSPVTADAKCSVRNTF